MPNFKNARPLGTSVGRRNPLTLGHFGAPDKGKLVEARLNGGMITELDPADIPNGALQLALNARVRYDHTHRRAGTRLFDPSRPDNHPVLNTVLFRKRNGQSYFLRFTPETIHYEALGAWVAAPALAPAVLTGSDINRFRTVTAFDRFVFTNGVDEIMEFDQAVPNFKLLGNAPVAKYITGFYNRIVAANVTTIADGPDPASIHWSADDDIEEWDATVDETAGFSPLIDSPSDLSDPISGLFGFTNIMVVMRERSIWLANKQAIPTNPFYFYTAHPGIGCDCPHTAVITLDALTWLDSRSGKVWHYGPGGQAPIAISELKVEKDIVRNLLDVNQAYAGYSPKHNEYTVYIPQVGSDYTVGWTFNFRTQAWTKDLYKGIASANDPDIADALVTIDDLGSTPIDELIGTIDGLSSVGPPVPIRTFGRRDGEITIEKDNLTTDVVMNYAGPEPTPPDPWVVPSANNATEGYLTELVSKTFTLPTDEGYFSEVRIEYIPKSPATMSLYYSKDGGVTWEATPKVITAGPEQIDKPQLFRRSKLVKTRRFAWKLAASDGQFEIIGYEVHVFQGATSRD